MAEDIWTTEPPTEAGEYWVRDTDDHRSVAEIAVVGDSWCVLFHGFETFDPWREYVARGYQRTATPVLRAEQAASLRAEVEALRLMARKALLALDDLVANSEGVAGLHLNGDVAKWDELTAGGRFGEWLECLEDLRALLAKGGR